MLTEELEFANLIDEIENGRVDTISSLIEIVLKNDVKRAIETGKSSLIVALEFTRFDDKRVLISGNLRTEFPECSKKERTFYFDKYADLSLDG